MIQVYTISQLEKMGGVPRSTIHYYLSIGLLPRPQKSSSSRSLYTADHLRILNAISELKESGLTLTEIEKELQQEVDEANESVVDLAAQEYELMHRRILSVAAQELTEKGYRNTHISTIVRTLGITTAVLYGHFSSKRRLLAECVRALIDSGLEYVEAKESATQDPAERLLWLCFSHKHLFQLGSTAMALTRVEEFEDGGEVAKAIHDALNRIVDHVEINVAAGGRRTPPAVPDELIAHSLMAAYEQTMFRVLADTTYRVEDALLTHLWLFLAIEAGRSGEIDIDSRVNKYRGLIEQLTLEMPPLPELLQK